MKPRLALTISCILFLSGILFPKEYVLSLSEEIIKSPSDHYYVADVINATDEVCYIGFVLKSGIPEPVKLKDGIQSEILSFLQNQFYEDENLTQLIIRINKLFYYESITQQLGPKVKVVDLNCTFIIKDSTGYHDIFTAACSVNSKDQEKLPSSVVANAFQKVFAQFHNRYSKGLVNEKLLSPIDLTYNPFEDSTYINNLLSEKRVCIGIFKTYYDFRDNTPDTSINFKIKYKHKETELSDIMLYRAIPYTLENEKIDTIWGFSDGKNVYWKVNGSFYLLEKDEKSFYIGMVRDSKTSYAAIGAAVGAGAGMYYGGDYIGGTFGVIGGSLVGGLLGAASGELVKVDLNFATGTSDSYLHSSQKKVESNLLFYASNYNKSEIKLSLNGEYCCTLLPDTWAVVSLPSSIEIINASFTPPNSSETNIEIIPSLYKTDYYFCIEKKKKPLRVTKANFEKREFLNRSISENNQVTTNCFNQ